MLKTNEGNKFWNRVDALRDRSKSLKHIIEEAGLNYEVVKVQRSLNRMPRAEEVCRLSVALKTPAEWLVLGSVSNTLDDIRVGQTQSHKRLLSIIEALVEAPGSALSSIEKILNIEVDIASEA